MCGEKSDGTGLGSQPQDDEVFPQPVQSLHLWRAT